MRVWAKSIRNLGVRESRIRAGSCEVHLFDRDIPFKTNAKYFLKGLYYRIGDILNSAPDQLNWIPSEPVQAYESSLRQHPPRKINIWEETVFYSRGSKKSSRSPFVDISPLKQLPPQAALDEVEKLIEQHPDHPALLCFKGRCLSKLGRLEEAEAVYRETIELFPYKAYARNGLAETLAKQGRLEEAASIYRKIIKSFPKDKFPKDIAVARNGLADTLAKSIKQFMGPQGIESNNSKVSLEELIIGLKFLECPQDLIEEFELLIKYQANLKKEEFETSLQNLLSKLFKALRGETQAKPEPASFPEAKDVISSIAMLAQTPKKRNFTGILRDALENLAALESEKIAEIPKPELGKALNFLSHPPKEVRRKFNQLDKELLDNAKQKLIVALRSVQR